MQNTKCTCTALLGVCVTFMLVAVPVHAQGMVQSLCHSHSSYLETAFQMQRQQMPLDVSLRMVSRVWQRQPRLAMLLETSITEIYRNPDGMVDALRSGRWQQVCERHLMGG